MDTIKPPSKSTKAKPSLSQSQAAPLNTALNGETYLSNPFQAFNEALNRLQRTNLVNVLLLAALGSLVLMGLLVGMFGVSIISLLLAGPTSEASTSGGAYAAGGVVLVGILTMMVVAIVLTVASEYMFVRAQNNQKVSITEAVKRGIKRFFPALGAFILTGLILLAGLIALVLPAIYLMIRLAHVNSIVANEDVGPMAAIKRSFALTKGRFVDTLGAMAIVVVIAMIAQMVLDLSFVPLSELPTALYATFGLILFIAYAVVTIVANITLSFRYHQADLDKRQVLDKQKTDPTNYAALLLAMALTASYLTLTANMQQTVDTQTQPAEQYFLNET